MQAGPGREDPAGRVDHRPPDAGQLLDLALRGRLGGHQQFAMVAERLVQLACLRQPGEPE